MGVVFQSRVCRVRNAFCMMKNVFFLIYNNNNDTFNCNDTHIADDEQAAYTLSVKAQMVKKERTFQHFFLKLRLEG